MYTLDVIKNEIKQLVATVVLVGTSPGLYLATIEYQINVKGGKSVIQDL